MIGVNRLGKSPKLATDILATGDVVRLRQQDDGSWMLPQDGAVTSHILKQPTTDFPDLLENELYCSLLAREAGLEVPKTGLPTPDMRIFCVERFDRVVPSRSSREPRAKLHQEDFCQIYRTDPDRKYERDHRECF